MRTNVEVDDKLRANVVRQPRLSIPDRVPGTSLFLMAAVKFDTCHVTDYSQGSDSNICR